MRTSNGIIDRPERIAAHHDSGRRGGTIRGVGVAAETYHAQDRAHVSIPKDIGKPDDEATERILAFLRSE